MGSGHILVYAFDVLMDIYKSCGYTDRDAAKLILQHNLYGLDIDDRAYQLAYFAVMMKARAYSRRILNEGIRPHLCAIQESNGVDSGQWAVGSGQGVVGRWQGRVGSGQWAVGSGEFSVEGEEWSGEVQETLRYVLDVFHDAKEYGSILHVEQRDYQAVLIALAEWERTCELTLENHSRLQQLPLIRSLLRQADVMSRKYDVVVTNPPYMGSGGMSGKLSEYVKKYYADSKADLFAVFIEKGLEMANNVGYNCMVTMQTWMFLSSFEKLREKLLKTKTINNLMHMENMVMGIAFGTAVTVFHNRNIGNYKGTYNYIKLSDIGNKNKPREFPVKKNRFAQISMENFKTIPGMPIAYWIKNYTIFLARKFSESHFSGGRNKTHNNEIFVRKWWETKQTFDWKPYSNGGVFRKWYGNNLDVVLWTPEARNIYSKHGGLLNEKFWDKEGITWNDITSGLPSFRIKAKDSIFSSVSPTVLNSFCKCDYIVLGFCNSKVSVYLLNITNPTMHTLVGNVLDLPDLTSRAPKVCAKIVKDNIHLAKSDWDSFETSWDFARHPLLKHYTYDDRPLRLPAIFRVWATETEEAFAQLKANEEELNRIFIDIYGLQDELTPEVDDKDITIRKADLQRDIRSFISYAVGCMFGRYSLDVDGLVYAGGDFTNHYPLTTNHFDSLTTNHYHVDADNVIPITDTEYFSDDIVTRFVEFIKVVYGQETLEENLDFTAQALGNKGNTSREIIRNYFLKDFYADHVKVYQKRPIYWLFDSGKENGFKALMYMHRYDQDTVGRVRADYLHKAQAFIENAISHCDVVRESNAPASEKAKAVKQKEKLVKQLAETRLYDQAIAHIAYQRIAIELDDGVVVNYAKFQGVEVANEGKKAVKIDLLAKV